MNATAVDDGVVRAAHRLDEIGEGRSDRRGAGAVENVLEREVQSMRLVDRNFEHARGDLHGACEAPRRCVEDRQAFRIDAAVLRDMFDGLWRRSLIAFDDERRLRIAVDVAEFFVEFLDARKSARRTGTECEEARRFVRDRPACVLASEAGDDRMIGTDDDTERPIRQTGGLREGDGAEPAHADFAEATSGFEAADNVGAEIDDAFAVASG